MTVDERRDKALRHFVSLYGPNRGAREWATYCRKSGLLPSEDAEPEKAKPAKGKKK